MKNIIKITFVLIALTACQDKNRDLALITGGLPQTKADYQKMIVGQLTGEYPLANDTFINSRWTQSERELTKQYLKQLIATLGIDAVEQAYTSPNLNPAIDLILSPYRGANVYGVLPATNESREYIVLGGHYDTGRRNAPGAIDNATGIALIYSVVKELSKVKNRDKNLLLVFFDQEEEELIGSKAFAQFLKRKRWDVHSVHCFDMVGWDADKDRAMEVFTASEMLLQAYKTSAQKNGVPIKDIVIDPVGYDNSSTDFDAFVPLGFEVIGGGECFYHRDSSPYKDTARDTYETVDFQYLLSCTKVVENAIKILLDNE